MIKRHEDALAQRFDAVVDKGFAFIEWWELYRWYGLERISKAVWRDLRDRFVEAADDKSAELWVYEATNGIMLIHSDDLKKVSDRAGASE